MTRILIPFTDPQDAERAIRRLLDESPSSTTSVRLLAVVEPLTPGRIDIYLSRARAEALARAAAARWIDYLRSIAEGREHQMHLGDCGWVAKGSDCASHGPRRHRSRAVADNVTAVVVAMDRCPPRKHAHPRVASPRYCRSVSTSQECGYFRIAFVAPALLASTAATAADHVASERRGTICRMDRTVSRNPAVDCAGPADCAELLAPSLRQDLGVLVAGFSGPIRRQLRRQPRAARRSSTRCWPSTFRSSSYWSHCSRSPAASTSAEIYMATPRAEYAGCSGWAPSLRASWVPPARRCC